jgi:peptidoglycan/xylan/chitin deacetylase (PgdA/CDA1 family)
MPPLDLSTPGRRLVAAAEVSGRYRDVPGAETAAFVERVAERTGSGRAPAALADGLWMTWDQARALRDAGMAIGGHTVDHPVLGRLTRDAQRQEIDGCAARLREELGIDMSWFSYPVGLDGAFDEDSKALLKAAGTRIAFEFKGGYQAGPIADPLSVPRAGVPHDMTRARFGAMLGLPQRFSGW